MEPVITVNLPLSQLQALLQLATNQINDRQATQELIEAHQTLNEASEQHEKGVFPAN